MSKAVIFKVEEILIRFQTQMSKYWLTSESYSKLERFSLFTAFKGWVEQVITTNNNPPSSESQCLWVLRSPSPHCSIPRHLLQIVSLVKFRSSTWSGTSGWTSWSCFALRCPSSYHWIPHSCRQLFLLQSWCTSSTRTSLWTHDSDSSLCRLWVVFESPVRSGLLPSRGLDRDRDRSFQIRNSEKTGLNRKKTETDNGLGLFALQDRSEPVYGWDWS